MLTDTSNYEVWLRTGVGDPVSYFSGASDYTSVLVGSVGSGFNLGAAQIKLAQNGSSTYPFFAKIELFDPFNSGIRKKIFFHAGNHDSGTPTYNYDFHGNGVCNTNTDAVSGIMIRTNSGNIIDGLFQVKGYL